MKKLIVFVLLSILTTGAIKAQVFAEKAQAINAGLGFGQTYFSGSYYSFTLPAIVASYEYGIVEIPMGAHLNGVISVGGFVGWSNTSYKFPNWGGDLKIVYNSFLISARGNYHFIFHDKIDTYAGIHLGYTGVSGKWKGDGTIPPNYDFLSGGFTGGAYVGGRYYFNDYIAVYAELGWMLAILQVGATFRLYQ